MSSTAAAELFGIDNINDLNDSVKMVISKLGELYLSVEKQIPVLDFKKTITGSNLEGSLLKVGVLQRGGTGASAYRYDNGHGLRVSNHSAKADNFSGTGEHLSITLFERGKMNDFVSGEASVIEAVFRVRYLDNNPDALKALIHDIAHFIVYREYHDTAGALRYNYSGTDDFKVQAEERMNQDRVKRENASNKISTTDSDGKQLSTGQQKYFANSVVRDDAGRLLAMYHGTSRGGFTVFDIYNSNHGLFGMGSYFTASKAVAEAYTKKGKGTTPQVYAVYLDIRNPMDMDAQANPAEWAEHFPDADFPESGTNEDFYRAVEQYYEDEMYSRLEAADSIKETLQFGMGYDGITHMGGGRVDPNGESHRVYIAFTEEQINSVDNLNPTTDIDINRKISSGAARRMLVDAFEEMIQSEDERKLVDTYRNYLNSTEDLEAPLMEVRSQIRQKVKEKAPKAEIDALRKKAETIQSALDTNDALTFGLSLRNP